MNKIIAISLLCAISFHTFSKAIVLFNFKINQSEIAQKYCENKAKPKMKCGGKCHLMKKLKEEENKEKNPISSDSKEKTETQYFSEISFLFHHRIIESSNHQIAYRALLSHTYTHTIFSPPKC